MFYTCFFLFRPLQMCFSGIRISPEWIILDFVVDLLELKGMKHTYNQNLMLQPIVWLL